MTDGDDDNNDGIHTHEVNRSMYPWIRVLSLIHDRPSVIMTTWNTVDSCEIHALDGVGLAKF